MKKTFLIITLIFALLLSACAKDKNSSKNEDASLSQYDSVILKEDEAYKEIKCTDTDKFSRKNFSLKNSNLVFKFSLPDFWDLKPSDADDGYVVLRSDAIIGTITTSSINDEGWKTVFYRDDFTNAAKVEAYIQRNGMGEKRVFRYKLVYTIQNQGVPQQITSVFTYNEVGPNIQENFRKITVENIIDKTNFGILSDKKDGKYLILGNSFIASSGVADILNDMFDANDKKADVKGESRGYATVNTYATDSKMISDIEKGEYDIVFLCGFYSNSEISPLDRIISACEASKTSLVIFPAHNESASVIEKAISRSESTYVLNWKSEIDMLINSGIDKWDFCLNDEHLHSTALAGYVGAHMIYRAIYGEVPAKDLKNSVITQKEVNSKLDKYVTTGFVSSQLGLGKIYFLG